MATDLPITGLPAASTPLAGTEVLPIVKGGVTDQVSVANLTAGRAVGALSLALGTATSALGVLTFAGNTSGTITMNSAAVAGTWTFTLPADGGTNLYFLQTNGSGTTSWAQAVTPTNTVTMTNKIVTPRLNNVAAPSAGAQAWSSDTTDQSNYTAIAQNITISADSGAPTGGRKAVFRFKDAGTTKTITWTTSGAGAFRAIGITLPIATTANKTTYVGCIYNATDSFWDAVATTTEA